MIYAVIDTNVLVSAFITRNPHASTSKVVKLMLEGIILPLYNEDILAEYVEVLSRPKFCLNTSDVDNIIDYIRVFGFDCERVSFDGVLPDEDDRVFYEVSLGWEDSYMITGNKKHFPINPRVVSPAEILEIIGEI